MVPPTSAHHVVNAATSLGLQTCAMGSLQALGVQTTDGGRKGGDNPRKRFIPCKALSWSSVEAPNPAKALQ